MTQHDYQPKSQLIPSASGGDLRWSDNLLVGHHGIDEMHLEFVSLANALNTSTEATVDQCLNDLQAHLRAHFSSEKALMEATEYPVRDCHIEEHSEVENSVNNVCDAYRSGKIEFSDVMRLSKALIDWFPGHIFYMDSALSTWVSKKQTGGAPVVLKRKQQ